MKPELLKLIEDKLEEAKKKEYEECFIRYGHVLGDSFCFCLGAPGNTWVLDFINEECFDCPYFTIGINL